MFKRCSSHEIVARYQNRKEDSRLCLELERLKIEKKSFLDHAFKEHCSLQEFRAQIQTSTGSNVQRITPYSANPRRSHKKQGDYCLRPHIKHYFSQWVLFSNNASASRRQQEQFQLSKTRRDQLWRNWDSRVLIRRCKSAPPTFLKHMDRKRAHSKVHPNSSESQRSSKPKTSNEPKRSSRISLDYTNSIDLLDKDARFKEKGNIHNATLNCYTSSRTKNGFLYMESKKTVRPTSAVVISTFDKRVHSMTDNCAVQHVGSTKERCLNKRPNTAGNRHKRSSVNFQKTIQHGAVIASGDIAAGDKRILEDRKCHEKKKERQTRCYSEHQQLSAGLDCNNCQIPNSALSYLNRPIELDLELPCCKNFYRCYSCLNGEKSLPVSLDTGNSNQPQNITAYIKPRDRYKLDPAYLYRRDHLLKKVYRSYVPSSVSELHRQIVFPKTARQRALQKLLTKTDDSKTTFREDTYAKTVLESKVKKFIDKTKSFCANGLFEKPAMAPCCRPV